MRCVLHTKIHAHLWCVGTLPISCYALHTFLHTCGDYIDHAKVQADTGQKLNHDHPCKAGGGHAMPDSTDHTYSV